MTPGERYNPRSPDGNVSTFISLSLFLMLEQQGWDMRWCCITRPIPVSSKEKRKAD
jgi:hypothetical protein